MIIVDTNILVNSIIEDSDDHLRSLELLTAIPESEESCITFGVLVELGQVLFREKGSKFAALQVNQVAKDFRVLFIENLNAALECYSLNNAALSFVDCEIVTIAKLHGASVLSFDAKLLKNLKES